MKKGPVGLLMAVLISLPAICQSIKVPAAITSAFNAKYPGATNVKWGKENAKEFEAEFKMNNESVSSNFKADGSWVESETVIPVSGLPVAVTNAINTKYPGAVISIAEKLQQPGNKLMYEAVIKFNGKKKTVELNSDGSFKK